MANKDFKVKSGLDLGTPLALTEGGTGQTSADNALNALLPVQTSSANKVLQTDGTSTSWVTLPTGYTKGDTASRPGSPALGDIYSNTQTGYIEVYTSAGWSQLGVIPTSATSSVATDVGTSRAYNEGAASVAFTPGAGGGLVTSYTAASTTGGYSASGSSSPVVVTGIPSNTALTFTVTATNGYGNALASAASASATITTVPQTPTIGTPTNVTGVAFGSTTSASVPVTANATGGKSLSGFTVTSSPGSLTATNATSPVTVTGLTSGTAYTFTAVATNANGDSTATSASSSLTPSTAPQTMSAPTATNTPSSRAFNNGAASVAFTAPSTGNSTITGYTITSSPGGFTTTGSSSPLVVTGLQSNTAYTFTATATNANGTSTASAASNSITATTVPQAPTIGTATGGEGSATVTYTTNATGGSAITSFTATSSPGSFTGTGASPITVSGLSNGTAYTFTVTATNANGTSVASTASNSVTPALIGAIQAWSTTGGVANVNNNNQYRYMMGGPVIGSAGASSYRFISVGGNSPQLGQQNAAYRYSSDNTVTGDMSNTSYASPTNTTLGQGNRPAFAMNYNGNFYYYDRATSTTSFLEGTNYSSFTSKANFPSARSQQNLTSTSLGVYAYGTGINDATSTTRNARWTSANSWTTLADMPVAMSFVGAVGGSGYAMSVGGSTTHGQSSPTNGAYLYNESSNTWSTVTSYPQSKTQLSGAYVGTGSTGIAANRFYFMNGFLTGFGQDNVAYSYSISSNAYRSEGVSPGNAYSIMSWTGTTTNANNILTMVGGEYSGARAIYQAQVI